MDARQSYAWDEQKRFKRFRFHNISLSAGEYHRWIYYIYNILCISTGSLINTYISIYVYVDYYMLYIESGSRQLDIDRELVCPSHWTLAIYYVPYIYIYIHVYIMCFICLWVASHMCSNIHFICKLYYMTGIYVN